MDIKLNAVQSSDCTSIVLTDSSTFGDYVAGDIIFARLSISDYESQDILYDKKYDSERVITVVSDIEHDRDNTFVFISPVSIDIEHIFSSTPSLANIEEGTQLIIDGTVLTVDNVTVGAQTRIGLTSAFGDWTSYNTATNTNGNLYVLNENTFTYPMVSNTLVVDKNLIDTDFLKDGIYVFTLQLKFDNEIVDADVLNQTGILLFHAICLSKSCIRKAVAEMTTDRMAEVRGNRQHKYEFIRNKVMLSYMALQASIFAFELQNLQESVKQQNFSIKLCKSCIQSK